ncbi:hypothetical protein [Massilia brevitalea]|uniref:hypothetical protein n=1 Tax=Massilia brevitalea TaxID=442526 RepID=UPI002739E870|nr:hypothetical protein [Massilia brevitalea]
MTDIKAPRRASTEQSRERMRQAALSRYDSNAEETHKRVRAIMRTIQEEMAANAAIYPRNKGAVSLAEVARRAGIHPVTFHKERYVELASEVKLWLETLRQGATVGRVRVRKELGTRVQEWKQLYESLRETHRVTETDLAYAQARLQETLTENGVLHERIAELSKRKVVPLKSTKDA